jgi:hypothetical protein
MLLTIDIDVEEQRTGINIWRTYAHRAEYWMTKGLYGTYNSGITEDVPIPDNWSLTND